MPASLNFLLRFTNAEETHINFNVESLKTLAFPWKSSRKFLALTSWYGEEHKSMVLTQFFSDGASVVVRIVKFSIFDHPREPKVWNFLSCKYIRFLRHCKSRRSTFCWPLVLIWAAWSAQPLLIQLVRTAYQMNVTNFERASHALFHTLKLMKQVSGQSSTKCSLKQELKNENGWICFWEPLVRFW